MAAPTFTLRTVTEAGDLDQFLPDYESLDLSPIFSAPGTVVIKYPANGVNFALLGDDVEIAVLRNGVEVGELRCIIESSDGSDVSDAEDGMVWTFTARTMLGLLDRAIVYPKNWPVTNPPNHDFIAATPGKILVDLMNRVRTRGALTEISLNFTATHDSNGAPWLPVMDIAFDAGAKYSEIVQNLVDARVIEVRMVRRQLQAFNPDTLGVDRSVFNVPLRFLAGRDIKESPRKSSTRELATSVLLAGDNNLYLSRQAPVDVVSRWGLRESYHSQEGATSQAALNVIATAYAKTLGMPVMEVTHSLFFDDPDNPQPVEDFDAGDWGLSDVGRGLEKFRILQWTASIDSAGQVTGSVVLNDLISDRIERLSKNLSNITSGAVGTGASQEKDDGKSPHTPVGVIVNSDFYLQGNLPRAFLTVGWAPVLTNADNTPTDDVDGYQARWRYAGESFWRGVQSLQGDETTAFFDNIDTNADLEVSVSAQDKWGHSSAWSPIVSTTSAVDTDEPPQPSAPVVTSVVGTLRVVWDGKTSTGTRMPADFAGVEVHVGPNGTFTPDATTLKDFFPGAAQSSTTITDLPYNVEYWVRLVATDITGNRSPASAETSTSHVVLGPVVITDIGNNVIDFRNIRFKDVGNLIADGSFEFDTTAAMINAGNSVFRVVDNPNGVTASPSPKVLKVSPGASTLNLVVQTPASPDESYANIYSYRAVGLAGSDTVKLRFTRYLNGNTTSVTEVTLDSTSNTAGVWTIRKANSFLNGAAVYAVQLDIVANISTPAAVVYFDQMELRKRQGTVLIEDAAINNAQIANLAVNDAKIANMSVGKLTVGTLTADITVSARIKTANTGARVELNNAGLQAFNVNNLQTVNMNAATGAVTILGQLSSGASGQRLEINPSSTLLPELRFYPSTGSNFAFINAISLGNSSIPAIGMNSGQFSVGGVTQNYRLLMSEFTASLETIVSSTQQWKGGRVTVTPVSTVITAERGNNVVAGFISVSADTTGVGETGAEIGYNDPARSNEAYLRMMRNGEVWTAGTWVRSAGVANCLIQADTFSSSTSMSGLVWSWAMDSTVYPVTQLRDSPPKALTMSTLSTTGWEVEVEGGSTTGAAAIHWWGWR